jgi:hypothetical protein
MTRSLSELVNADDPAWPMVQEWIAGARNKVEMLSPAPDAGEALHETQVTLRSPMGAVIYHTGGLLVDHGWVRILGSGNARLPRSLPKWNRGRAYDSEGRSAGFMLVADDVLGGFFAINGGAFGEGMKDVFYFAPDTLRWESLERGYSDFLLFCFQGELDKFYEQYRWDGWERVTEELPGDQGLLVQPFLFTKEGQRNPVSRTPAPMSELWEMFVTGDIQGA